MVHPRRDRFRLAGIVVTSFESLPPQACFTLFLNSCNNLQTSSNYTFTRSHNLPGASGALVGTVFHNKQSLHIGSVFGSKAAILKDSGFLITGSTMGLLQEFPENSSGVCQVIYKLTSQSMYL